TGEYFSAGDIAAGVTFARQLTDRFAIGFTTKYIQETIWHESANAFAIDAGTTFKTDLFGGLVIAATLSNFGTKLQMTGRDARQFISVDPSQQGTNNQIPASIEMNSWDLPLLFQFGVSTDVVKQDSYRWTVTADALHPSDDYESMNVGTQFSYQDIFFVRTGFQSLFLADREGGFSLGVGVSASSLLDIVSLKFDYAYRDMGILSGIHVVSVRAQF
ncbi:MAG TPA: PorV/PorQ family protein, partial [Bacteroidota bacterium]|nr:PorV/PorQ family protein [Bacteroidota bacterium]